MRPLGATVPSRLILIAALMSLACSRGGTILAPETGPVVDRQGSPHQVRIQLDPDVDLTQPLLVRHGFLTVRRFQGADAVFEGRGFRIEAFGIELGVAEPCFPCQVPGEATTGAFFAGSFLGNGPAAVGEEQFDRLFYGGQIEIMGDPVTLNRGRAQGVVVAPITLTATLRGFLNSALIPDPEFPSIDVQLIGQGSVKIDFELSGDRRSGLATWETMEYTFRPGRRLHAE